MKLAALALASTFAVCSSLAQTVGGIAGGSSKAGSPAALSTTTSASISGGESHRKHKAYSELSGMRSASRRAERPRVDDRRSRRQLVQSGHVADEVIIRCGPVRQLANGD